MIEHRPLGQAWIEHRSRPEYMQSDFLRLRQSVQYLLEDSLQQYTFVSYGQLEDGAFDSMAAKVMILPQSVAMSGEEIAALRRFVEARRLADCRFANRVDGCALQASAKRTTRRLVRH